jgi:hypothetical protein
MTAILDAPCIQLEETILAWDLTRVKLKMIEEVNASKAWLNQMEIEYKRYLLLLSRHGSKLPISSVIDEMWHAHVLFTRDYAKLGQTIGWFIHHEPTVNSAQRQSLLPAYNNTLSYYQMYWGTPNPTFWPANSCVCDPEGEGTNDTGGQW